MPAASASVSEANRHAAPVPIGRLLGRKGRITTTTAGGHERDRDAVGDRADHVTRAVGQRAADLAARPAEVEHAGEEDAHRDEEEADQVELALFEDGQAQPQARAPATGGLAPARLAGRRLAGRRCLAAPGLGHERYPFDTHGNAPSAGRNRPVLVLAASARNLDDGGHADRRRRVPRGPVAGRHGPHRGVLHRPAPRPRPVRDRAGRVQRRPVAHLAAACASSRTAP